jgi:adenylate cyclase, class 2
MTPTTLEREIKLRFASPDEARAAVRLVAATPLRGRRLQEDVLLDSADDALRARQSVLRVRIEAGQNHLTFKGPVQPAAVKVREELETTVGDGALVLHILEALGFQPWFRYQKYREEFACEGVVVAIDETPIGTFVELEGSEAGIHALAARLGRTPADYILDSYRGIFVKSQAESGGRRRDMVFDEA